MNPGTSSRKQFVWIGIVVVVLAFIGILFFKHTSGGKIPLELNVAPREAVATLNGKKIGRSARLSADKYDLEVSANGFQTYKTTFSVNSNSPEQAFAVALSPLTDAAKKTIASQQELYTEIEGIGGQKAQAAAEQFLKDNPIVGNLPQKTSYYGIDYSKDASGNMIIQITASTSLGRQVAIEKIRSWGFDPTNYNLQFIGLTNPFGTAKRNGT